MHDFQLKEKSGDAFLSLKFKRHASFQLLLIVPSVTDTSDMLKQKKRVHPPFHHFLLFAALYAKSSFYLIGIIQLFPGEQFHFQNLFVILSFVEDLSDGFTLTAHVPV
jgi:hypothetical protein